MNAFSKIWNAINGNKTTIGMIIVLLSQGMKLFVPGVLSPEQLTYIESIGLMIGGVGVGHKALKTDRVKNAINRAKTR